MPSVIPHMLSAPCCVCLPVHSAERHSQQDPQHLVIAGESLATVFLRGLRTTKTRVCLPVHSAERHSQQDPQHLVIAGESLATVFLRGLRTTKSRVLDVNMRGFSEAEQVCLCRPRADVLQ
jgi:hypothetical protein